MSLALHGVPIGYFSLLHKLYSSLGCIIRNISHIVALMRSLDSNIIFNISNFLRRVMNNNDRNSRGLATVTTTSTPIMFYVIYNNVRANY